MPDNILFTGESDFSDLVKGIDNMTDALKRGQAAEAQLAIEHDLTTQSAKESEEGIKKLTAQIAALDKTSKDYAATNQQLTGRLNAVKGQYDQYTATIAKQEKELDTLRGMLAKMPAVYDAAAKSAAALKEETNKPIAPSINDGKLTAVIGGIRDKVKGVGADIAQNINTAAPAIDNVASSVTSLGAAFGPEFIVAGIALGAITKQLYEMATAETEAEKTTRLLNESMKSYVGAAAEATDQVDIMKLKFELAREGLLNKKDVLDEYNNTLGKTLGVTKDFNEAEQTTIDNADTYIKIVGLKAQATALANLRIKESEKALTAQLGLEDNRNFATKAATWLFFNNKGSQEAYDKQVESDKKRFDSNIEQEADARINVLSKAEIKIQTDLAVEQSKFADKPKTLLSDKGRKETVNIYEQELQKLKADIAKLNEKGFTDEATITAAIEADFKNRDLAFQKAFKNKQLTAGQLASLQDNLKNLQQLTLDKSLKDFADQKAEYLKKINDQISSLQDEESLKRIQTLQDSFERERQTIISENDKTIVALKQAQTNRIAVIKKDADKNGLTQAQIGPQIAAIESTYSKLFDDLEVIKNQKLQKLSFDTFEKLSEDARRMLDSGNLGVSEGSLIRIQDLTAQYQSGKISYQKYQKELTEIARYESNERFQLQKLFLEAEIKTRQDKLESDKTLTDDQVKRLKDEIRTLTQQLTDAEKGNAIQGATDTKTDNDKKLQNLLDYANAIKSVTDGVIAFWQQTNEAEQKALDQSIALQDRRVDAARNVAEKGNAEYLRLEEEKDQELIIKKENAARRQMAINAALQASQLLVAITGAIAKIAEPGVGTVDVIASIGLIVGSLAAGYALVKSLQQNQPSFYVGTEDTGHGGKVDNRGGFNAVLHPHERVLTAEENKKLKGISNEELIKTVQNHRLLVEQWKAPPPLRLNIEAMEMATNHSAKTEAMRMEGMERRIDETNLLQKGIIRALKGIGVSMSIDRNGVGMIALESAADIDKNKKL